MLRQLRHKRFTITMIDMPSALSCYSYAQSTGSIVPVGNENDAYHQRPDYDFT